jgi:DNA-binding beta-propeller fold protein YncE
MRRLTVIAALFAAVATLRSPPAAGKTQPVPIVKLSLSEPQGIRFDAHNHLYVADTGNNRILELSTSGRIIHAWGQKGSGPGQFELPQAVTVDPAGNLYVADYNNRRLQKLSPAGRQLAQWKAGDPQFGCECRDVLFAGGSLYVADESTVYLYRMNAALRVTAKWDTGASSVVAVATDRKGNVWIATAGNEVEELSPTGKVLVHWGKNGTKAGRFDEPAAIAVDAAGNLYVADSQNNRVQKLSPRGRETAIFGQGSAALAQASNPEGVAVDRHGNVYVADTYDNRIQVFSASGSLLAVWAPSS